MPKDGEEEEVEEEVEISGMAGNVVVGCMPRGVPVTIVYGDTHCIRQMPRNFSQSIGVAPKVEKDR